MDGRTCTVVLIGTDTAQRKWINHEIIQAWKRGMGVVGIHIHGLKSLDGMTSTKGQNPFDFLDWGKTGQKFSSIVKCYDPSGSDSKQRYDWFVTYLGPAIEEAINIRKKY